MAGLITAAGLNRMARSALFQVVVLHAHGVPVFLKDYCDASAGALWTEMQIYVFGRKTGIDRLTVRTFLIVYIIMPYHLHSLIALSPL